MKRLLAWARRWRLGSGDRGAFTPMVVVMATALFASVALAVDGGGKMRALERADNIAAEAARAAGQAINVSEAVAGTADVVDPTAAAAAATAYLTSADATGTVTISTDRREITVIVSITYQPVMLDLINLGPWTETGTATAELVTQ
jgi:Flp pilus assembly protein TadG